MQIAIVSKSKLLSQFIQSVQTMSKSTANQYNIRLHKFEMFLLQKYGKSLDTMVKEVINERVNPYEILNSFCIYLRPLNLSTSTIIYHIVTARNFLEFHDVEISPRRFKLKVRLPKAVRRNKEALSKEEMVEILNACSNIRLKTYILFLAATGCRAGEAASIRLKDIQFDKQPATLSLRGEFTKTKTDRTVFLTYELIRQIKTWLEFKYRNRRVCYVDKETRKTVSEYRTPERNEYDLIFGARKMAKADHMSLYIDLCHMFERTLDRMGKGEREENNNNRRKITLHSFRRHVKTTVSDLGYQDFSEFLLGHAGSTYWRKKDSEKGELFKKVEPYLTYLNIAELERQGADIQSKLEELAELNRNLRERDNFKDDIITGLSDRLIELSERVKAIEKR